MIVLLDHIDSFSYNLYHLLRSCGASVKVVSTSHHVISDIHQLQPKAIVLSPGPGSPDQAHLAKEVLQAYHGKIPILGICLGMQVIAYFFGVHAQRLPSPAHGVREVIQTQGAGLFSSLEGGVEVGRYHSLHVPLSPMLQKDFFVDAYTEQGIVMAIRHKQAPTFGIQFHPESIMTPQGSTLVANFLKNLNV